MAYNWDFFNAAFPDGTPPTASPEALWALLRVWTGTKKQELRVEQSSSAVEQSLRSSLPGRVHIHWKANLAEALDKKARHVVAFDGVLPDVRGAA